MIAAARIMEQPRSQVPWSAADIGADLFISPRAPASCQALRHGEANIHTAGLLQGAGILCALSLAALIVGVALQRSVLLILDCAPVANILGTAAAGMVGMCMMDIFAKVQCALGIRAGSAGSCRSPNQQRAPPRAVLSETGMVVKKMPRKRRFAEVIEAAPFSRGGSIMSHALIVDAGLPLCHGEKRRRQFR
mmetsp:Transcript_44773/g.106290  ORF Transcript_44773/g.106290 Transcript_44773/m.106290 type:complete len:192 (+) Transcript_44773:148-723(+)